MSKLLGTNTNVNNLVASGTVTTSKVGPAAVNSTLTLGYSTELRTGHSGSGYPYIGYNVNATGSANSYTYASTDTAWSIDFGYNGAMSFKYAASGTSGNTVSFTNLLSLSTAGASFYSGITASTLSLSSDFYASGQLTHTESYSVPTATYVPINLAAGVTTFAASKAYHVRLVTVGTGTATGATYIVYQTAASPTFAIKLVSSVGTTANYPQLRINVAGTGLEIFHAHASTYSINTFVTTYTTGNTTLTSPYFFGLDGALTRNENGVSTSDNFTANALVKSGGTALQLLKADGTVLTLPNTGTQYLKDDGTFGAPAASINASDNQTNANYFPVFSTAQGTGVTLGTDSGLTYNPSNGYMSLTGVIASQDLRTSNAWLIGNVLGEHATNGVAEVAVNYHGYGGGTTQFRNLTVYNGKNSIVWKITGSSGAIQQNTNTDGATISSISHSAGVNSSFKFLDIEIGGQTTGLAYFKWERGTSQDRMFSIYTSDAAGTSRRGFYIDATANVTVNTLSAVGALVALSSAYDAFRVSSMGTAGNGMSLESLNVARTGYVPTTLYSTAFKFHNGVSETFSIASSGQITTPKVNFTNPYSAAAEPNGYSIRLSSTSGYMDIGNVNGAGDTAYLHLQTGNTQFYMNKPLHVNGEIRSYSSSNYFNSTAFYGNGSGLTNLTAANLSGTVPFSSLNSSLPVAGTPYGGLNTNAPWMWGVRGFQWDALAFVFPTSVETLVGSTWTAGTVTDSIKNVFLGGDMAIGSAVIDSTKDGMRFIWSNTCPYFFTDGFYLRHSTNGNNCTIEVESSTNGSSWTREVLSTSFTSWPGHTIIPARFNMSGKQYLRITILRDHTNANNVAIYSIRTMSSYGPDARAFTWDYAKNVHFSNGADIFTNAGTIGLGMSGDAQLLMDADYGLIIRGRNAANTTYDMVLQNKSGTRAMGILTGTANVEFMGSTTAVGSLNVTGAWTSLVMSTKTIIETNGSTHYFYAPTSGFVYRNSGDSATIASLSDAGDFTALRSLNAGNTNSTSQLMLTGSSVGGSNQKATFLFSDAGQNSLDISTTYPSATNVIRFYPGGTLALTLAGSGAATFASSVNAASYISGVNVESRGNVGFHNDAYSSNVPNPIWSFGNSNTYGMAYYQGSALFGAQNMDAIGFHFGAVASPKVAVASDGAIVAFKGTNGTAIFGSASKYVGGGTQTGTVQISLPVYTYSENTMITMIVRGYDYTTRNAWSLQLGFYTYSTSSNGFDPPACNAIGTNCPFSTVRFCKNASNQPVILLGTLSSTWSYAGIHIAEVFINGYSAYVNSSVGWSISLISSEASYTLGTAINPEPVKQVYRGSGGAMRMVDTSNGNSYELYVEGGNLKLIQV